MVAPPPADPPEGARLARRARGDCGKRPGNTISDYLRFGLSWTKRGRCVCTKVYNKHFSKGLTCIEVEPGTVVGGPRLSPRFMGRPVGGAALLPPMGGGGAADTPGGCCCCSDDRGKEEKDPPGPATPPLLLPAVARSAAGSTVALLLLLGGEASDAGGGLGLPPGTGLGRDKSPAPIPIPTPSSDVPSSREGVRLPPADSEALAEARTVCTVTSEADRGAVT